jgi:F0F1-type ATP synthase membrane subunit c/vacuolar-type H+-ATPase subunit K
VAAPRDPALESTFRNARIIHAALVASLVVYAVVVHVLRATAPVRPPVDVVVLEGFRVVFYFVAGGIVLGALLLRMRWLTVEATAPLPVLQTRLIICLAFAETIGVLGLLLALMGGSLQDFYVLWVPAIGLMLWLTPRREVWEAAARGRARRSR